MQWAVVDNGIITNVVVSDEKTAAEFGFMAVPDDAKIGDDWAPERESYTPTTEERLAALETAMLSMMGVTTDV